MRIAINARDLAGQGGTYTYLYNVLSNLPDTERVELDLLVNANDIPVDTQGKFAVSSLSTRHSVVFDHIRFRLTVSNDVDVAWFPKNVLPIYYRGKSVVTIHDLGYFVDDDLYPLVDRTYMKRMIRHACSRADHIIAVSQNTKKDILEYTSASPEKISVVYHGVDNRFDRDISQSDIERFRRKNGLDTVDYVYGGNLGRRKNANTLIKAFESVNNDDHQLVFTDSRPTVTIPQYIKDASNVKSLGLVDRDDMPILYSEATMFVNPSRYEGFGLSVLEAMKSGTPVISSDAGSLPEVVGDAGLLFAPQDTDTLAEHVSTLMNDLRLKEEYIQRGHKRASEFTWTQTAERTLDVLTNIS